jgi:hypothetical protein
MSLVGSVSLTNGNGVYLGKVNLNNFDASANSIVYSVDGTNMKGNQYLNYDETSNTLILNNNPNGNNAHISLNGDTGGVNKALTSNGASGLKWVPLADGQTRYVFSEINQQQSVQTSNPLVLYEKTNQYNIVPNLQSFISANLNININGGADILTLQLYDLDSSTNYDVKIFNVPAGQQTIPVLFTFTPTGYSVNFQIIASIATHTINVDLNSYISVYMNQLVPSS